MNHQQDNKIITDDVDGRANDGARLLLRVSAVGVVSLRHCQNRIVNQQLATVRLDAGACSGASCHADATVRAVRRRWISKRDRAASVGARRTRVISRRRSAALPRSLRHATVTHR